MSWALVIHEVPDMLDMIAGTVTDLQDVSVECVQNLAVARETLMRRSFDYCTLIVVSASAPLDGNQSQPLDRMKPAVATFLADFRKFNLTTHCIVLPSVLDGGRDELNKIENVTLVSAFKLAAALRALQTAPLGPHARLPRHADVDISLTGPVGIWTIKSAQGESEHGQIEINWRQMQELQNDSERAGKANHKQLCQLGRQIYERLLAYPCQLEEKLAHYTPPGSYEGVRFRFEVDRSNSQLMVETMGRPLDPLRDAGLDFYMLQSPIYRKFGSREARFPLFKDKLSRTKPINCLIIQGRVEKFMAADPVARQFREISNAAAETTMLEAFLRDNRARFNVGELLVLRPADTADQAYASKVRGALSEHKWHLVHYAGHSALGSDDTGYLVLGDGDDELIDIQEFADGVRQAQFVFLSSCRSADASFIMKLVEKDIPAVAGYAWPINDKIAYDFAENFYLNLFAGAISSKFLEYAFMHARTFLHKRYKDSPMWTAPILFMQKVDGQRET